MVASTSMQSPSPVLLPNRPRESHYCTATTVKRVVCTAFYLITTFNADLMPHPAMAGGLMGVTALFFLLAAFAPDQIQRHPPHQLTRLAKSVMSVFVSSAIMVYSKNAYLMVALPVTGWIWMIWSDPNSAND